MFIKIRILDNFQDNFQKFQFDNLITLENTSKKDGN